MAKTILTSVVALLFGLTLGWIGHDLSGGQTDAQRLAEALSQLETRVEAQTLKATVAPVITLPPIVTMPATSTPQAQPTKVAIDYKIVDITSRVTEQNSVWWKYAWRLTVRNNGPQRLLFDAEIKFLDADEFIVDDDQEYGLLLGPYEEKSYTGYTLVDAAVASSVDNLSAETRVQQAVDTNLPPPTAPTSEPEAAQTAVTPSTLQPAIIPEGWRTHELFANNDSLAYPSDWLVEDDSASGFMLSRGLDALTISYAGDIRHVEKYDLVGESAVPTQALRTWLQETLGKNNAIQFFREGTLDAPHQPAYITAITTDSAGATGAVLLTYATDGRDVYLIILIKSSSLSFTDADMSMITDLIRSVDFS